MPTTSRPRFELYPSPELIEGIDRYRAGLPGVPPRADAARRLLEEILRAKGLMKSATAAKTPRAVTAR